MSFDDLLQANEEYARDFPHAGFDGIARQGVLIVTCMDSRIDPRLMIGMEHGDVKILRSPGGKVSTSVLTGAVLSVQLLNVDRIMIVPHTRCAMASGDDAAIADKVFEATGHDIHGMILGATPDQQAGLRFDVARLRSHPMIKDLEVEIGGFIYDVDTGGLTQIL